MIALALTIPICLTTTLEWALKSTPSTSSSPQPPLSTEGMGPPRVRALVVMWAFIWLWKLLLFPVMKAYFIADVLMRVKTAPGMLHRVDWWLLRYPHWMDFASCLSFTRQMDIAVRSDVLYVGAKGCLTQSRLMKYVPSWGERFEEWREKLRQKIMKKRGRRRRLMVYAPNEGVSLLSPSLD